MIDFIVASLYDKFDEDNYDLFFFLSGVRSIDFIISSLSEKFELLLFVVMRAFEDYLLFIIFV